MVSLTPRERSNAISGAAFQEGVINGLIALVPSYGAVWFGMKNSPRFVQATNWQSRTALVLMPALFTFAFSAERTLDHKMQELANTNEHIRSSAAWAEKKHAEDVKRIAQNNKNAMKEINTEEQLLELYRQSVANSGVRIVKGDRLGVHHQIANFWQEHPFKILVAMGVPAVAWIFYGRSGKAHLQFQMKVMHTRVMGQFTVIAMLLSLMGFKEYMDRNGKFITEAEADRRVFEMGQVREGLLQRLEAEKQHQAIIDAQRKKAQEADIRKGQVHDKTKSSKKEKKQAVKSVESISV